MNVYLALFISLLSLLGLLFFLRVGSRSKVTQSRWVERLETIARDNHTLWSTVLPYPQKEKVAKELEELKSTKGSEGVLLQISEDGQWSSPVNLAKYPAIKRLFRKLLPQIIAYSRTLGLDPKFLTLKAWAQIGPSAQDVSSQDALFSGLYFLKGLQKQGGQLSFYKKYQSNPVFATFVPRSGDLLLYPSDMQQALKVEDTENKRIHIAFNVHFGNRRQSWLVSKMTDLEAQKIKDPYYDTSAEPNSSEKKQPQYFHISKIK